MNYDWLEDSKVLNKGRLEPRCFYSLDPRYKQSLNGLWHIKSYDAAESPFNDTPQKLSWEKTTVPSHNHQVSPECEKSSKNSDPSNCYALNHIYKKTFDCNPEWKGKKTILSFDAVPSAAYFWLNGIFLGFSKGSFTEIEFDISDSIHTVDNELIVQIFSAPTSNEHCDNSGIVREVYLYSLPEIYIRDYHISTSWNEKTGAGFELNVDFVGDANVEVRIYDNDEIILVKDYHKNLKVSNLFLEPWSFENPKCYLLELCIINSRNEIQQIIPQFIGFRSVEIRNGFLNLNGKYLTVKGIKRNEHSEKKNYVIDEEDMLLDIRMMKAANINAVSNADHAFHQKWYELCDKYGLLIIDSITNNKNLTDNHLDDVQRMYHRSKNHSCVIAWNLGIETEYSFEHSYSWVKSQDKYRMVIFSESISEGLSDLFCPESAPLKELERIVRNSKDRPTILTSYGETHGNALGGFQKYWDLIDRNDCLQGGFLDGYIVPGIKTKNGSWEYRSINQLKGIILPDRTPHPSYFELKKVFQGITFRLDIDEDLIVFRNNNLFEPVVGVIEIRIWTSRMQLFFQRRNFELPANSSELITYQLEDYEITESVFLDVKTFINNGEIAGEDQFILHKKTFSIPVSQKLLKFPYAISPIIIRPSTQVELIHNDSASEQTSISPIPEFSEEYIDESTLKIKLTLSCPNRLNRFGVKINLPKIFSQVNYLGRGSHENYIDRKSAALWGQYYTTPEKMIPSYICPQESGYRSENEKLVLTDLHGNGFKFSSNQDFGFSYLPYSPEQLNSDVDNRNKALLIESSEYILCIDSYMSGIGIDYENVKADLSEEKFNYEFILYITSV